MPAIRTEPTTSRPKSGTLYCHDPSWKDSEPSAHPDASEHASSSSVDPSVLSQPSKTEAISFPPDYETKLASFVDSFLESLPSEASTVAASELSYPSSATDRPRKRKTRNPFIIFRSFTIAQKIIPKGMHQDKISCRAADYWHALGKDGQRKFHELSAQEKTRYALYGPAYVDAPKKRKADSCIKKQQPAKARTRTLPPFPESPPIGSSASTSPTLSDATFYSSCSSPSSSVSEDTLGGLSEIPVTSSINDHIKLVEEPTSSWKNEHLSSLFPSEFGVGLDLMPLNSEFALASEPSWSAFDAFLATCPPSFASAPSNMMLGNSVEPLPNEGFAFFDSLESSSFLPDMIGEPAVHSTEDWSFLLDMSFSASRSYIS